MPASRASERVRRLLAVVPYVVQHPGVETKTLTELFGTSEKELADDLGHLFMTGLPPYSPGDLIDVQIEEGRVWIRMADQLSRPARLTRAEAVALYLRAKALIGTPGLPEVAALSAAVAKLETGLGRETLGELSGRVETDAGSGPPSALTTVREAAERHERLEIEYYSASSDQMSRRRVEPEAVFSALGNWYLAAWDEPSDEERLFRVDRIRSAEPTGQWFDPRGSAGSERPLYSRSGSDTRVRLLLGPGARWIAEHFEVEGESERDAGLEVILPARRLEGLAKVVLVLGGEAEVLEPSELREMARDLGERTLALYI